jgi:hypothetical protein
MRVNLTCLTMRIPFLQPLHREEQVYSDLSERELAAVEVVVVMT